MKESNPSGIRPNPIGNPSTSRANNMNNQFPLLRLPLLAIEEILKRYTPYELLALSTLSKRAKAYVGGIVNRQHFNLAVRPGENTCLELRYKNNESILAVNAELAIMFGFFENKFKECNMNLIGSVIPVKLDCMMDDSKPDEYDDEDDTDYIPEEVDSDEEEYVEIDEDEMGTQESKDERERALKYLSRCARDTVYPNYENRPEEIKPMIKVMLDFFKNIEYVDFCPVKDFKDMTLEFKRYVEVDLSKNVNHYRDSYNRYNYMQLIGLLSCREVRIKAVISDSETEIFLRRWIVGGANRLFKLERINQRTNIRFLENSFRGRRIQRIPNRNAFRVERDDGLLAEIGVSALGTTVLLRIPNVL